MEEGRDDGRGDEDGDEGELLDAQQTDHGELHDVEGSQHLVEDLHKGKRGERGGNGTRHSFTLCPSTPLATADPHSHSSSSRRKCSDSVP